MYSITIKPKVLIIPPFLSKGDKIAIVSPAGTIAPEKIDFAKTTLQKLGFDAIVGKHAKSKHFQYAGTDKERTADFQNALNDKHIKAIFCARGGYGSARIIDMVDWSVLQSKPKWIVGYSDITAIHSTVNKLGIASIHGTMPVNYTQNKKDENLLKLLNVLMGTPIHYTFKKSNLCSINKLEAEITGGNLSVLYSIRGTKIDAKLKDKILFIEDLNEYLYHLDRMLMNFALGDIFSNIKGLIVGGMTDMKDNNDPYGQTAQEIIASHTHKHKIPVCFNFPSGHQEINMPFILGNNCKIETTGLSYTFRQNY